MLRTVSRLEVKINDRIYHFTCENDSPIEHVKEALFQFQKCVGQIEDSAKAQEENKKENDVEKPIEVIDG